jgi:hypothetical protein
LIRTMRVESYELAAWLAAMRRGNFAVAWEISDRVLARGVAEGPCWASPRHEQSVWDGRRLESHHRVLVRCYHGLGDTIQFARFLPLLAQRVRELIVWAQPPLIPLLATMPDVGRLLPLHDGAPGVDYDVDIEIMEIPHVLRTTLASLQAEVPYLHVPEAPRLSDRCCLGVVAQSGVWDPHRSVPPDLLAALGRLPGVALFSLQPGGSIPGAVDASDEDLLVTAARVRALDLVVTVDTLMAHLAGALGVPTWTLLQADADWRWMADRDDSPWYPTMRLFRQPRPGAWEPVVASVVEACRRLVAATPLPA